MCSVTGMESPMAEYIKAIILASPALEPLMGRPLNINTYCLTFQYIFSVASLPINHLVRVLLAIVIIKGYLYYDNYKFSKEAKELNNFSINLLKVINAILKTLTYNKTGGITFKDPFNREIL
jgi:hypothetical protein